MKRVFGLFLLSLLVLSFTSAISIEHEIDSTLIVKEYPRDLNLDLTISDLVPGKYNVYTLSDVHILPFEPFQILSNQSELEKSFTVVPMERLKRVNGTYIVRYFLNHRGVEKFEENIALKVLSIADLVTIESNLVDIESDQVTLTIKNLYDFEIPNVTARFTSVLFDIEATFDLPKNDIVEINIPVSNDELRTVKAGSYLVDVIFDTPEGEVATFGSVFLMEREDVITQEDSGGLFIYSTTVNKVNTGNTIEDVRIEVQKNVFTQFFTSFNREPLTKIRDGTEVIYVWEKRIAPSEVYSVKASTNYLYPIILLIVIYFAYRYLRTQLMSRVVVRKTATRVQTRNGEFALRVRVIVQAKSAVTDVTVVDTVPKTVKIYKKFGLSMPDEIDTVNRRLKWNAGDLRPGEERVYSYVVYSRVGFLGRFFLPAAFSHYNYEDRERKEESSAVFFTPESSE